MANKSPLGKYYVRLKDTSGTEIAVFDDWVRLSYVKEVNDLGSFQFVIKGNDPRVSMFDVDCQVEVRRSVPGMGVGWTTDFEGFHRKQNRSLSSDGRKTFTSTGVGYNDLLARTAIAYKEGTVRAEKNAAAETVMKEYVTENCTVVGDTTAVGRLNFDEHLNGGLGALVYSAILPGLSVQKDGGLGPIWHGDRAYENLLSTLQDIAATTGVDFDIVGTGNALFEFRTYANGIGSDRRKYGVNPITGLNASGFSPVVFAAEFGTVQTIEYTNDRTSESNVVMVLGQNELSLREVYTVADTIAIGASPWNRREITRSGSNQDYEYQYRQTGDEALKDAAAKIGMEFDPMQTESHCYGLHYFLGDTVTAIYDEVEMHKRITKIEITVEKQTEKIGITFSDVG